MARAHEVLGRPLDPVRWKWLNVAMGLLLAATLWPLLA